jgi:hypothetical protein
MPVPQADTPTDVAATDDDTYIRLGIGAHSVRTTLRGVKSQTGESGVDSVTARSRARERCRRRVAVGVSKQ